jgi:kumamolisin
VSQPLTVALPAPSDPAPDDGVLRYLGFDSCVRLPLRVDAVRLAAELARLPAAVWGRIDRDPVVHAAVESFFAVGYPRGPRPLPPDDRPVLLQLPYLREILHEIVPASPTRAIVARMQPHSLIPIHTDTPRFFRSTVRLSIQVDADGVQRLYCNGVWYDLAAGEVWAVDNLRPHGVDNAGGRMRTNVIADYLPSNALVALIADGDHALGMRDETTGRAFESTSAAHYRAHRWQSLRYELGKRWRRGWRGGA